MKKIFIVLFLVIISTAVEAQTWKGNANIYSYSDATMNFPATFPVTLSVKVVSNKIYSKWNKLPWFQPTKIIKNKYVEFEGSFDGEFNGELCSVIHKYSIPYKPNKRLSVVYSLTIECSDLSIVYYIYNGRLNQR